MKSRAWTVATLAKAAGLDLDQTLVALWSEGVEYPLEPSARIRPEDARVAERAVGLANSQAKRVAYWLTELSMSRQQLETLLASYGLRLDPRASTLPKGAVRRIRSHFGISIGLAASDAEVAEPTPLASAAPFVFKAPGSVRECVHLSADEIRQVHDHLTEEFRTTKDPISPPGVKFPDLLESAATRPSTGYGNERKYPTVESAAAALLHSLVHNHAFHNGNKRTALVATLVVLDMHDLIVDSTENELYRFMLRVSAHDLLPPGFVYDLVPDREVEVIARWIKQHTHRIRNEDRALTWRDLQRKLREQDCEIQPLRGEKFRIVRIRPGAKRLLGTRRDRTLETYFINTGDGREVARSVVKKMRQDLELVPEHGVDAEVFYGGYKGPDFFILEHQKLLGRLARV